MAPRRTNNRRTPASEPSQGNLGQENTEQTTSNPSPGEDPILDGQDLIMQDDNPGITQGDNEPQPAMTIALPIRGTPPTNLEPASNLGPGTSGESASSGLHESDNDSDPEIRGAQRELQTLRKQRKLATIRAKIEEERRLLAQQTFNAGTTEAGATEPRGQKRRRSDSESHGRPPSRTAMANKYRGKNIREFTTFMTLMENHFRRYADYFTSDERKVAEGVAELSEPLVWKWGQYEKDIGVENIKWKDFYEFHINLINDPKALLREASQKYTDARQLPNQSIRTFAAYLAQWERQLVEQYTENQRKEHLRTRILPEIRREALKYREDPQSYEGLIAHLQSVENTMSSRKATISTSNREGFQKSARHNTQGYENDRHNQSHSNHIRRNDPKHCSYCGKHGHLKSECYRKQRETEQGKTPKPKN